ncbi:zinc finger MYM-type protein 1-like [Chenopodium quinoa]|uniref:zinc finger MYM-type protein 1-like n=1 Tax=Chenopodium quinoa TaxID=63459 RepID=UPI000B78C765|nr:zinc finger MYM-type protein 1-like [Chenopodium quinoa]
MSLESFWKRAGKSQKSSTCSSPSSRDPPIEEHVSPNDDEVPIAATIPPPENTNTTVDSDDTRIYDVDLLPHDPGKRIPVMEYPPNDRDAVRRGYITKKRCDPRTHNFPQRKVGGMRRFNVTWFDKYEWLEYSVEKDAAFCFVCYLFTDKVDYSLVVNDSFIKGGFRGWNKTGRFDVHVGGIGSFHNQANEKYSMFINPKTSVAESLCTYSKEAKLQYKSRLTYSLKCIRFLLNQGLACRGHNESEESWNRGNFLALLTWFSENNSEVAKVVLGNAPGNNRMTSPLIQKELINCCAKETTRLLIDDIGDDYFGILADESSDVSQKEQMALCLRYVNNKGKINERFLGIVHVKDTTALSLKSAIESLLMEYSLSLSRVRGQGYDGASNMRGEINGLKTLIMNETKQAYYIHCFAHQLQLTLVAVAKDNDDCIWLFDQLAILLNIIGVSCKRREMIREIQSQHILQALELGEIESGQGLNQEHGLGRPGDTRWGSHYKTVSNVTALYATIVKVLEKIGSNKIYKDDRVKAITVMSTFESFEFVFMIHLMSEIFGITDKLCQALQKGDQDIVNAMTYVKLTKEGLQQMRDHGWEDFLHLVVCFCVKHDVEVPTMDDMYVPRGRSRRFFAKVSNLHRFRVEMFISVIDLQLQELNSRFDEENMELLICVSCLNPINSFAAFDMQKLLRLAELYPKEFPTNDMTMTALRHELQFYINDVRQDARFGDLKGIHELSMMLVETNKHTTYNLVYLLIRLALILPVATASVERVFSSMTYVKNKLRNSMGDQLLNDNLVTFLERDLFSRVSDDDVLERFQSMKTRRMLL